MKNKITSVFVLLLASISMLAQKQLTLDEIWSGAFRAQGMTALEAMKNTNQYTVLDFDRASKSSQINLYDFATLNKVATLLDSKDFTALQGVDSYTFSKDEKKLLIANNSDQIFRH